MPGERKERHFPWPFGRFRKDRMSAEMLSSDEEKNFRFVMGSNGFFSSDGTEWKFNPKLWEKIDVPPSLLGVFTRSNPPEVFPNRLFTSDAEAYGLREKSVLDIIGRYREIDEAAAKRIGFLLGRINIPLRSINDKKTAKAATEFAARMINLGRRKSGEAIASTIVVYLLSKTSFEQDTDFERNVSNMAEIMEEDQNIPWETEDLGISQAIRLQRFIRKIHKSENQKEISDNDILENLEAFYEFPTIGAEFHIPVDTQTDTKMFWQKLAILNMSQYQKESSIPLSRNEDGIIEVRMNPSVYPVAIATWNLMKLILPEINKSYFSITINRKDLNFSPVDYFPDKKLIELLHTLGSLGYAALFQNIPRLPASPNDPNELRFGRKYLGQTVRVDEGKYSLTGNLQEKGQLSIYTGFGNLFPELAYYLSMGMAEPELLEAITEMNAGKTILPSDAVRMKEEDIRSVFEIMESNIQENSRLRKASIDGEKIIAQLRP